MPVIVQPQSAVAGVDPGEPHLQKSMLPEKLIFIDNLKVFLTILVILHHTAITYGADGSWFYEEVKQTVMPDSLVLTLFAAVNQSFFMGLFFFLSGAFVASSLMRKSTGEFMSDKLIRLGIPVLLFIFLVFPLTVWVGHFPLTFASFTQDIPRLLTEINLSHTGPTWFILVLLMFNIIALACRTFLLRYAQSMKPLTGWHYLGASIAVGAISFLTRLVFPDGFVVLNVQLSYMPQYIVYFFVGVVMGVGGITQLCKQQQIKHWLIPAIITFLVMVVALGVVKDTEPFKGGFNPWSILYSFIQGFHSVAFSVVYIVLFYRVANRTLWLDLGRSAYGAFFIHALVIVAIAIALQPLVMAPMLKFLLLGIVGVPASFALGYLLTRLPGLRRVF